tara:strand:- start:4977 stop:5474 length:498 start_codon:yes stop_codon:yes gene_type:complete
MSQSNIIGNAKRAIRIIPHDTINIPNPSFPVTNGTADGTTAFKLVNVGGGFDVLQADNQLNIGDIVYNTSDFTVATVTAIDSADQLSLSADIFVSGKAYQIYKAGMNDGCVFFSPFITDLTVLTAGGDKVNIGGLDRYVNVGLQIIRIYDTGTAINSGEFFGYFS